AGAVPVQAARVLQDRDLDLGQAGGGAVLERISGRTANVLDTRRGAARRVGRRVQVAVIGREGDLRVRLLRVEQGRVVRRALGLDVAGLVGRDRVEGVVAVALARGVAEAVVDPGARVEIGS